MEYNGRAGQLTYTGKTSFVSPKTTKKLCWNGHTKRMVTLGWKELFRSSRSIHSRRVAMLLSRKFYLRSSLSFPALRLKLTLQRIVVRNLPIPNQMNCILYVDFMELPRFAGHDFALLVTDGLSRYSRVFPLTRKVDWEGVLKEIFQRLGSVLLTTKNYLQRSGHPVYQPYWLVPKRHGSHGCRSPVRNSVPENKESSVRTPSWLFQNSHEDSNAEREEP